MNNLPKQNETGSPATCAFPVHNGHRVKFADGTSILVPFPKRNRPARHKSSGFRQGQTVTLPDGREGTIKKIYRWQGYERSELRAKVIVDGTVREIPVTELTQVTVQAAR